MNADTEQLLHDALADIERAHDLSLDLDHYAGRQVLVSLADKIKVALSKPAQPEEGGEVWGWAILDKNGTAQAIRPRRQEFFGCVQESEAFSLEDVAKMDREWAGLVPHSVATLYTAPPASQEGVQQSNGYTTALEIRTAQGWNLTGNAVPVLYTDEINGWQVMRDDVWLCTTDALKQQL